MKDILLHDGFRVTTWYDRKTKNYITQLLDEEGNQVGDADYDSNKDSMKVSRNMLVLRVKSGEVNVTNS